MNPDILRAWADTEDRCKNYAVAIRLRSAADAWEAQLWEAQARCNTAEARALTLEFDNAALRKRLEKMQADIYIFEANWITGGYHEPEVFWEHCFHTLGRHVPKDMTLPRATSLASQPEVKP